MTSRDRHWPHHVRLSGEQLALDRPSFAMTEQPRTIARARITGQAGTVGPNPLAAIDQWLSDFTDL